MYHEGKSMNDIARHFGLHRTTVRAILDRTGITIRSRAMTPAQIKLATKLYEQGLTYEEISRRLGFTDETIAKHVRALKR